MIGQTVSHYRILEELGGGGMGVVYKARDTKLDRTVALKFLPAELTRDPDAKKRFTREARAASALQHNNICTIHEIDETEDGRLFIVMDCYDGETLKDRIARGPLPVEQAVEIISHVADGLSEAHASGMVHRDIKPANIMVTGKGVVKILDFGLAKLAGATRVTKSGWMVGTAAYMSPEQARGEELDARSDIWSLGAVLYEMLTGEHPFKGDQDVAVLYGIVNAEPEPLSSHRTDIPETFQGTIDKTLAKDKDERFRSVAEFQQAVSGKETGSGSSAGSTKRKLVYGVSALVILSAVILSMILASLKDGAGPDTTATTDEHIVAVMYFENIVDGDDPDRLGEIATNLLITGLSESESIRVLSSQRTYDILKSMGRDNVKSIDRETATEIANQAGARTMLLGSILQTTPVLITSQIVDVVTGEVKASQRVQAGPNEQVFALIDRLLNDVRDDLDLADGSSQRGASSGLMSTINEDAYRKYLEGIEFERNFHVGEAIGSYTEATELDSTFAMAHYALAWMLKEYETIGEPARREIAKARQLSARLGKKEKQHINSLYADIHGDFETAIRELEELIEAYPDEKLAYYRLGDLIGETDQKRAIEYYEKAIDLDPAFRPAYEALSHVYQRQEDFDNTIWAITNYINLAPEEPAPYVRRGDVYLQVGNFESAIESYEKALERDPEYLSSRWKIGYVCLFKREYEKAEQVFNMLAESDAPFWRSLGKRSLADILRIQGKMAEAIEMFDGLMEPGNKERYLIETTDVLWVKAKFDGPVAMWEAAAADARRGANLAISRDPNDPYVHNWEALELLWRVRGGQVTATESEETIARLRAQVEAKRPQLLTVIDWFSGCIAFEESRYGQSVEYIESATVGITSWVWYYPLVAAYRKAGRPADSVELAERLLGWFDVSRARSTWSVLIHYTAGVAFEEAGQMERAIEQYRTFLDLWKNAGNVFPELEDARQRLRRLEA
jgi:serine/threonine protein kinase/Tfp pilus assembly protein PilF